MTAVDAGASPSPFVPGVAAITATDDEIAAHVDAAELAPLLPALAYLTGDLSLLVDELRPDPLMLGQPSAGYSPEQQARIRSMAAAAIARYRNGGC
ncbi:MAG: hypothetical protein ACO3S5_06990, partial [Ilumatobacteraceae bacterium]